MFFLSNPNFTYNFFLKNQDAEIQKTAKIIKIERVKMEEVHPETMMVEVAEILEIKKGVAKVQERKKEAQK